MKAVASGAQAIAEVRRRRPDLVLLDLTMSEMSGLEVLRRLRGIECGLPVVMLTGNADVDVARTTLRLGAFDYIAKPVDLAYFDRVVAAALPHELYGQER